MVRKHSYMTWWANKLSANVLKTNQTNIILENHCAHLLKEVSKKIIKILSIENQENLEVDIIEFSIQIQ